MRALRVIVAAGVTGDALATPHRRFETHPGGGAAVDPHPSVARDC